MYFFFNLKRQKEQEKELEQTHKHSKHANLLISPHTIKKSNQYGCYPCITKKQRKSHYPIKDIASYKKLSMKIILASSPIDRQQVNAAIAN